MKMLIILLMISGLIHLASGQQYYRCIYKDSMGIVNFDSQIESMRNGLVEKGAPPEIADLLLEKIFPGVESFSRTLTRTVSVYADSAIIEVDFESDTGHNKVRVHYLVKNNKLMVKNGRLFHFNISLGEFKESTEKTGAAFFTPAFEKEKILGFPCEVYRSLDSSVRIWVSPELPSTINPGIAVHNDNIVGAILRFEVINENAFTASQIQSIEKLLNGTRTPGGFREQGFNK
jgi:hypothetical protein